METNSAKVTHDFQIASSNKQLASVTPWLYIMLEHLFQRHKKAGKIEGNVKHYGHERSTPTRQNYKKTGKQRGVQHQGEHG